MKIKKIIGILAAGTAVLTLCAGTQAKSLTPSQAVSRVLALPNVPSYVKAVAQASLNEQPTFTFKDRNGTPTLYIFSPKMSKGGFLITPADDGATALLAYSEANVASPVRTDPLFTSWVMSLGVLKEYSDQIEWSRRNGAPGFEVKAKGDYTTIMPMLTTKWSQHEPYYDLCPMKNGEHSVTGCVATAMAQMMKYYNWPPKGVGSNSYYCERLGRTMSADFGDVSYAWSQMRNTYNKTSTPAQIKAVATLMLDCGISANMEYSPAASSAYVSNAAKALIRNFRYQPGIVELNRLSYSLDEWYAVLYTELKNSGPLFYAVPGHACIIDGYTNGYFHFNWGWGGQLDGYFRTTVFMSSNPAFEKAIAQNQHSVLARVRPDKGGTAQMVLPYFYAQDFYIAQNSATLGSQLEIRGPIYNGTMADLTGSLGLKLKSPNGQVQYVTATNFRNLAESHGFSTIYATLPRTLASGSYVVTPAVTTNGGQTWYDIPVQVTNRKTITITVSGNRVSVNSKARGR